MHVGIGLLTLLPGQVGGSETNVRGLLGGLGNSDEAEVDGQIYTVLTNPAAARSLEEFARGPVRVTAVQAYRPGRGSVTRLLAIARARYIGRRLARAVLAEGGASGFDVVHFPLTVSIPRLNCPAVVTVYDLQHELMPEFFSPAERAYRRLFYTSAIASAAVVVTISEFTKAAIVERHGIESERVLVSLLAVDRELFAPGLQDADARQLAPLGLPERFVVYPANLWRHKNHERLLEAMSLVRDRELGLVLTGQQYGRWPRLLGKARRLGIAERVQHLGYVDRDLLPAIYRAAEGMVFPSLYEGFGLPPMEALACGCPVAAADAAALPEMLADRAIWFDPNDPAAIAEAVEALTAGVRQRSEQGSDFWRGFTWDEAASVHRSAYELAADRVATRSA